MLRHAGHLRGKRIHLALHALQTKGEETGIELRKKMLPPRQDNDDLNDDGPNHQQKNVPQLDFWGQRHELLRVMRSAPDKAWIPRPSAGLIMCVSLPQATNGRFLASRRRRKLGLKTGSARGRSIREP
jgi:hypothetical protein